MVVDDIPLKLQIWDTAGQERYRSITQNFYKGAKGILVVFDITDQASFDNVKSWLQQIRSLASEDVSLLLIGNKSDLEDKRVVTKDNIDQLTRDINVQYFEVSARTGSNVEEAFYHISKDVKEKLLKSGEIPMKNINIGNSGGGNKKEKKCCGN